MPRLVLVLMRIVRVVGLGLLLLVGACVAPTASQQSASSAGASPTPAANRAPDALYVRQAGNGSPAYISVIDARTGSVLRALPDGVVSPDRRTVYITESLNGARQTRVRALDATSGEALRAFVLDGDYIPVMGNDGPAGLSGDGRWLVLQHSQIKIDNEWVSGFVALNTSTGAVAGRADFRSSASYLFAAIAADGSALFLNAFDGSPTQLRVYDFASAALLPVGVLGPGWDGTQDGFAAGPVASTDGRWLSWLNAAAVGAPSLRTLDLVAKQARQVALPAEQGSTDYEKFLLWSLALAPDGRTLYAVNPALGVIDEVDPITGTLRRTHQITVSRTSTDVFATLGQFFFPVAEAKRYIRGGAVLSPDGRTLYAAGTKGLAVIDTTSLASRGTWMPSDTFDAVSLSPDGARLYAISDQTGTIVGLQTSDGAPLGTVRTVGYPGMIVRIDLVAGAGSPNAVTAPAPCGAYAAPDPSVAAEIQHLKTSATVVAVTSPCTVQVTIAGGIGPLLPFVGRTVILRATSATTFASATDGDLEAIGRLLKPNDTFTLSFDSRAFPDGTYPLNFLNR